MGMKNGDDCYLCSIFVRDRGKESITSKTRVCGFNFKLTWFNVLGMVNLYLQKSSTFLKVLNTNL